jgi:ribosomal protein S18 acetylase RimI-like enzyme
MDVWQAATDNWSELCVAMGCTAIRTSGAILQTYRIQRSGSFYNSVFVQNPKSFVLDDVERFFGERKLPFVIILPQLKPYLELGEALEKGGYLLAPPWILMTHNEHDGQGSPDVRVEQIGESKILDWHELQQGFPHAEGTRPTRLEMIRRLSREDSAQLLIASLQDRFVGAGLLFMKNQVASLHMIATLAGFRRRHVATTVTLEAIRRARKTQPTLIWLRTRKGGTGEKVYKRIGFRVFSEILSYTKTPRFEETNLPPK